MPPASPRLGRKVAPGLSLPPRSDACLPAPPACRYHVPGAAARRGPAWPSPREAVERREVSPDVPPIARRVRSLARRRIARDRRGRSAPRRQPSSRTSRPDLHSLDAGRPSAFPLLAGTLENSPIRTGASARYEADGDGDAAGDGGGTAEPGAGAFGEAVGAGDGPGDGATPGPSAATPAPATRGGTEAAAPDEIGCTGVDPADAGACEAVGALAKIGVGGVSGAGTAPSPPSGPATTAVPTTANLVRALATNTCRIAGRMTRSAGRGDFLG